MNHIHPTIKFTFESSSTTIPFLDTQIYIDENRQLRTKLYKKPTDRSMLLHFKSHHPLHTKESVIYSQALRYNMIISNDSILQDELYNLTRTLLARHYPLKTINDNIQKALQFTQTELIRKTRSKETPTEPPIPFITKYTEGGQRTRKIIRENWNIITNDPYTNNIFPQPPVTAFQKLPTIANILIRSDTEPLP